AACEAGRALVRAADGMQPAGGGVAAGERDVDGLGGQPRVESGGVERDLAVGQRGADGVAGAVARRARRRALVAGQRAQRLELRGDAAALAEQRDAQGFQRLGCVGRGDVDQRLPRQLFNPTHRTASSDIFPSGVIGPPGHRITLSPAYFVTGLPGRWVALPPNHPVTKPPCHPERSEGSVSRRNEQIPRCVRDDTSSEPPGKSPPPERNMGKDLRPSPCVYRLVRSHRKAAWRRLACGRQTYAASAPFAFSASAVKPAASCTAMSASTLRSRVMPAFIRPFMKRL